MIFDHCLSFSPCLPALATIITLSVSMNYPFKIPIWVKTYSYWSCPDISFSIMPFKVHRCCYKFVDSWVVSMSILAIVSNACNEHGVLIFLQDSDFISFRYNVQVGLLDDMVILFLNFWSSFLLFFIMAVGIYIPTNGVQGFLFSTSLPIIAIFYLFDDSHSNRWKMISHGDFYLYFHD